MGGDQGKILSKQGRIPRETESKNKIK